jgi:hypothetical protein
LAIVVLLAAVVAACAAATRAPLPLLKAVEVSGAVPNRCAGTLSQACTSSRDCRDGAPCVATVVSDAPSYGRDGGHTVRVGDRVLWVFGDTFSPAGLLSATAGWSRLTDPQTLAEATGVEGMPLQFFPFTEEESRFNEAHREVAPCCRSQVGCPVAEPYCRCEAGTDCATRVALWPGDGVGERGAARLYYEKFIIGAAPYDFRRVGVGVARLAADDVVATRHTEADGTPRMIFGAAEPGFARGLVVNEDRERFYLFANVNRHACAVDVVAGRVEIAKMGDRASYEFWDGSTWVGDLQAAAPILEQIPGGLGSVMWNDALGSYLSAWSDICTGGRTLFMRVSPRPQGPWSAALGVDLAPLGATRDAYYGLLHAEFGNGRNLLLTYFQPIGDIYGQIRAVKLTLQ